MTIHLALCSLLFRQARMLGIMGGVNQKGFFKVVPGPIPMVFAAQADHGDSPVAVPQVVHLPVVAQRQFPMVQTVRRTIYIPQLLITVIDVPVVQVVQVFTPSRR